MSFIDDVFELRLEDIGEGDEVTFVGDLCVASRPSRARARKGSFYVSETLRRRF
jgi:hypothetical protein